MSSEESAAETTPYEMLGGEAAVKALVERFYALMDEKPAYADIRKLHPPTLESSTEKLFMFLSGWLGGPPLYMQTHGHPMLRARHLPFPIGVKERDQWMECMHEAMVDCQVPQALREALNDAFARTADHMRNRQEPGHA